MCGIAGILTTQPSATADDLTNRVEAMTDALKHRGPDGCGTWVDPEAGITLGHRRLAIVDLSPTGSQPMTSLSGRYVIVFNGEIYNFRDLRGRLLGEQPGMPFRGTSDTEVLLAAFETWGIDRTLQNLNGMFAFALWDRRERKLTLVRDRLGEKPLYYSLVGGTFRFASELKALAADPRGEPRRLCAEALGRYFQFGYVPSPLTIFEGVRKLPPGFSLTASVAVDGRQLSQRVESYWSLRERAQVGLGSRGRKTASALQDEFEHLLIDAVRLRSFADVPIGAFLSGGLDSTAVVTAMRLALPGPVRTYTIGFNNPLFDERAEAREVAQALGCDHHEIILDSGEFFKLVDRLPLIYDEPFADSSQLPSTLVCAAARRETTVCYGGDGGDELFGGYMRYQTHPKLWAIVNFSRLLLGRQAGQRLSAVARAMPACVDWSVAPVLRRFAPGFDSASQALARIAKLCSATDVSQLYQQMMSWHVDLTKLLTVDRTWSSAYPPDLERFHGLDKLLAYDQLLYLPENNLMKMDRASMACALEVRLPLLDHRMVEFSWQLTSKEKIDHGRGKQPLRHFIGRHLPSSVLQRPKRGFAVPIGGWLRTGLREWAQTLLRDSRAEFSAIFQWNYIDECWREHLAGRLDYSNELWSILVFLHWARHYRITNSLGD